MNKRLVDLLILKMNYFYGTVVMASCLAAAYADQEPDLMREAMGLIARASSTSEVLTLNLTNLLILLVLKALIFGFGLFSFGNSNSASYSSYSSYSRSAQDTSITETELSGGLCFMEFTSGQMEKLSCVQRSACEDPRTADKYLTGAKMWYNLHKYMGVIPFNGEYVEIMNAVEKAKDHAIAGGDCALFPWSA